ncbi:phosphatidylglycerol lysyltransferase domain-containing protein [Aliarcobacter butzleri]|nr:phosphatidylglycerol lysyltransferase domain-containing protein [Aliarcobacter butzleri]
MDGIYYERFAVKRLINNYDSLDVIGLVIYIDDEIKGFTVGEKINETTASVIIEKTDFEVLGCAQFIFREFTKILKDKYSVEYINVGDDMGFENLKKVKMSYRPKKIVPKYVIYQK